MSSGSVEVGTGPLLASLRSVESLVLRLGPLLAQAKWKWIRGLATLDALYRKSTDAFTKVRSLGRWLALPPFGSIKWFLIVAATKSERVEGMTGQANHMGIWSWEKG
jgi:hypothetical protein